VKQRLALFLLCSLGCLSAFAASGDASWKSRPGPWGDLEVRTVYLEAPDALLAAVAKPNAVTRWVFEQMSESGVRDLLQKHGVPAPMIVRLFDPASRSVSDNVVKLYPTVEELVSLPMAARSSLYRELAKSPANEYQRDPVYILGGDLDEWLSDSGLSIQQTALFRRLLWKRGEALAFSDIQALLTLAAGPEETRDTFRALTRVRSLIVELKLPLRVERSLFLDYWSAGMEDPSQLAFLRSMLRRRADQKIDITHLFPNLARQRVFTFPELEWGLKGKFPDCHWTSLNFAAAVPDNDYLDTAKAASRLVGSYQTVEAPYRFGDVLCFLDEGEGLHTCVYVADDIVFTKNGDSVLAPWVLMQLQDVESIYRRSPSTRIQGYRLKR
jgi:hypothetical protein